MKMQREECKVGGRGIADLKTRMGQECCISTGGGQMGQIRQ